MTTFDDLVQTMFPMSIYPLTADNLPHGSFHRPVLTHTFCTSQTKYKPNNSLDRCIFPSTKLTHCSSQLPPWTNGLTDMSEGIGNPLYKYKEVKLTLMQKCHFVTIKFR
jgi:hypothetical protein